MRIVLGIFGLCCGLIVAAIGTGSLLSLPPLALVEKTDAHSQMLIYDPNTQFRLSVIDTDDSIGMLNAASDSTIAYTRFAGAGMSLHTIMPLDTRPRDITAGVQGYPVWAIDEQFLVYQRYYYGAGTYITHRRRETRPRPMPFDSAVFTWSPQGEKVIYRHIDERNVQSIRQYDFTTGRDSLVSDWRTEIMALRWSPDGKILALVTKAHGELLLMTISTGRITAVSPPVTDARSPQWSPDGMYLAWMVHRRSQPAQIVIATHDGMTTRIIKTLPLAAGGDGFDWWLPTS